MIRFEYKIIELPMKRKNKFSFPKLDQEALHNLLKSSGEQGWELVSKVENTSGGTIIEAVLIFKRAVN